MLSRIRTFFVRVHAGRKIAPSGHEYMFVTRAVGGHMAFFWAIIGLGGAGLPLGFRIWCGVAALITFWIYLFSAVGVARWAELNAKSAEAVAKGTRKTRLPPEAWARVLALVDELEADLETDEADEE